MLSLETEARLTAYVAKRALIAAPAGYPNRLLQTFKACTRLV